MRLRLVSHVSVYPSLSLNSDALIVSGLALLRSATIGRLYMQETNAIVTDSSEWITEKLKKVELLAFYATVSAGL